MKNALSNASATLSTLLPNALPSALGRSWTEARTRDQSLDVPSMPRPWADREYRQAAMEAHVFQGVAWQIRVNREERGWKQSELAHLMGTKQSAVSRLEDPNGGDVRIGTLLKAANAFDCALIVRFVPYTLLAALTKDLSSERLFTSTFEDEVKFLAPAPKEKLDA